MTFEDFQPGQTLVNGISLFYRAAGPVSGEPLLLLHGFPETHLMWSSIAPVLASRYRVICVDLPGYGRSTSRAGDKSTMAEDLVAFMEELGFSSFSVIGHDRGARVAYRMALDHPYVVQRLAVLDIVPTAAAFDRANADFALDYWPWSVLAQDGVLGEHFLEECADDVVTTAFAKWGSPESTFSPELRREYAFALRGSAAGVCADFRAASTVDRSADERDLARGLKISCPVLVLWAQDGALDEWYRDEGGPLEIWRSYCENVSGRSLRGGHFFPESNPSHTLKELQAFLQPPRSRRQAELSAHP